MSSVPIVGCQGGPIHCSYLGASLIDITDESIRGKELKETLTGEEILHSGSNGFHFYSLLIAR